MYDSDCSPVSPSLHNESRPTLIRLPEKGFRDHAEDFLLCRTDTVAGKTAVALMCWTIAVFILYIGGKFLYALLSGGYAS